MDQKQMEVIVGLFAGMQIAVVHLCKVLERKGVAGAEEIAQSFQGTAAGLPADLQQRALAAMVLNQIAPGIRSASDDSGAQAYRDALH